MVDHVIGQAQFQTNLTDFILNNSRSGSTSFIAISSGRPPTLWCDGSHAPYRFRCGRLNDIGIDSALCQPF